MLIQNNHKKGDHIVVKLVSGEELIGRVEEIDNINLSMYKPMVLIFSQQGPGLIPFMPLSDDKVFHFARNMVVAISKLADSARNDYIQQTTGLTL